MVAAPDPRRRALLGPAALLIAVTVAVGLLRGPLRGGDSEPARNAPARSAAAPKAKATPRFYTVRAGDTLAAIARRTGVPVARLRQLNPKLEPTALFIGQKVRLR